MPAGIKISGSGDVRIQKPPPRAQPHRPDRGAAVTSLAPTLEASFTQRLNRQRQASPSAISSYRDTFRLLLILAARVGVEGTGS